MKVQRVSLTENQKRISIVNSILKMISEVRSLFGLKSNPCDILCDISPTNFKQPLLFTNPHSPNHMSGNSNCSLRWTAHSCTDSATIDIQKSILGDQSTIDSYTSDLLIGDPILSGISKSIDLNRLNRQYSITSSTDSNSKEMSSDMIFEQLYHSGIYDIHLLTTRNLMNNEIEWLIPDNPLPLDLHPMRHNIRKSRIASPKPLGIISTPLKVIEYYRSIVIKGWITQLQTLLTDTKEFDRRELNIDREHRYSLMDLEQWTPRSIVNTTELGFNNLTSVAAKFLRARLFKVNGVTPSKPPLMINGSNVQYNGTMKMTKYLRMIEGERINAWECGDLFRLLWLSASNGDNLRPILNNLKTDRWPFLLKLLYIYRDLFSNDSGKVQFERNFNSLNRCEQILLVRTVFDGHIEPHFLTTQELYRSLIEKCLPTLDPNIYIRYTRYIQSSELIIMQLMRLYKLPLPLIASLSECDRSNMERLIMDNENDLGRLIDQFHLFSHRSDERSKDQRYFSIHEGLRLKASDMNDGHSEINRKTRKLSETYGISTANIEDLHPLRCSEQESSKILKDRDLYRSNTNETLRNLVHYKWIVDSMDDIMVPNILNLETMAPLNLLCHTDIELIKHLNLNNPFGCRISWLINMYRCMLEERFFIPLERKSINKQTLLYNDVRNYECFMVAYGTLFRYRVYEPLELYQSFELSNMDEGSRSEIVGDNEDRVRQSLEISLSMAKGTSSDILQLPNQIVHFNRPYRKEDCDYSEFSNSDIRRLKWILTMRNDELLKMASVSSEILPERSSCRSSARLKCKEFQQFSSSVLEADIGLLRKRIDDGLNGKELLEVFRSSLKTQFRRLNRKDLKSATEWLSVLFEIGMYMRKWKGDPHPYPLLESDTLGTYDEDLIVDRFGYLAEIELRMSTKMRDRMRNLISYDLRHGNIINHHRSIGFYIDRVVLNDDKSDAGCIRVNSTIFIGTAYSYLSFLLNSPPPRFNPKCLEGIQ
jgi:hypothetical protein